MLWWLWIFQCVNVHTILSFRHKYMFPYTLQMRRGSSYPVNYNKRVFSFCGTFHFFDIFQRIMFIWLMKSYSNVNFFLCFLCFFFIFSYVNVTETSKWNFSEKPIKSIRYVSHSSNTIHEFQNQPFKGVDKTIWCMDEEVFLL